MQRFGGLMASSTWMAGNWAVLANADDEDGIDDAKG